ncbi:MAG: hypothetical protein QME96_16640, partial [Myxococcota bacterium]|nr:hypothetical protein [Myxococcota bacterium]
SAGVRGASSREAADCPPAQLSHWFAYYRAILLNYQGRNREALQEFAHIGGLDPVRYSWMLQSFVLVKLATLDFEGAIAVCRDILRHAPSHWWVRCRMAEAYLAKGAPAAGLREFARAERAAAPEIRREVLTWHGEVLLWLGEYEQALAKLDKAIALGAKTFVYGWRGAARLKLGAHAPAIEDLDRAVELDAKDFEARVWRGEAYRLLGRHAEALADLDHVVRRGEESYWTYFNRALAKDSLGDAAGMDADFDRIPREVTSFIARRLGLRGDAALGRARKRKILTAGLEMAKGVRRWEGYVQSIWMRERPLLHGRSS